MKALPRRMHTTGTSSVLVIFFPGINWHEHFWHVGYLSHINNDYDEVSHLNGKQRVNPPLVLNGGKHLVQHSAQSRGSKCAGY